MVKIHPVSGEMSIYHAIIQPDEYFLPLRHYATRLDIGWEKENSIYGWTGLDFTLKLNPKFHYYFHTQSSGMIWLLL